MTDVATETVSVLVVDDMTEVREGMSSWLRRLPGIEVVGTAADGLEAVDAVHALNPQVVLMDLKMPRLDGVEATRRICAEHPDIAVLIFSAYGDESLVLEGLLAGARGYLLKETTPTQIAESVLAVARGEARLSGEVTRPLLERLIEALAKERGARRNAEEAVRAAKALIAKELEFSTMAAHELRTPLTGLLGSLLMLEKRSPELPDRERELIRIAVGQARRLERLAEDLVTIAQQERGDLSMQAGPVNLTSLLPELLPLANGRAAGRVQIQVPKMLWVHADPDRVTQVLLHLLRNALQYSPPDSPVLIEALQTGDRVTISVSDNGPGIDPSQLHRLFDRFSERGPEAAGGLGIGLHVANELVSAMDGSLKVENPAGGGTTFVVELPGRPYSLPE